MVVERDSLHHLFNLYPPVGNGGMRRRMMGDIPPGFLPHTSVARANLSIGSMGLRIEMGQASRCCLGDGRQTITGESCRRVTTPTRLSWRLASLYRETFCASWVSRYNFTDEGAVARQHPRPQVARLRKWSRARLSVIR